MHVRIRFECMERKYWSLLLHTRCDKKCLLEFVSLRLLSGPDGIISVYDLLMWVLGATNRVVQSRNMERWKKLRATSNVDFAVSVTKILLNWLV